MSYTLYLYDEPLVRFDFIDHERGDETDRPNDFLAGIRRRESNARRNVEILEMNVEKQHLLPMELPALKQDVQKLHPDNPAYRLSQWLTRRLPPTNRHFIRNVLDACGLRGDDPKELADFGMMLGVHMQALHDT